MPAHSLLLLHQRRNLKERKRPNSVKEWREEVLPAVRSISARCCAFDVHQPGGVRANEGMRVHVHVFADVQREARSMFSLDYHSALTHPPPYSHPT